MLTIKQRELLNFIEIYEDKHKASPSFDEMREGIKTYSNWPTIPQLYVKKEFIGGCDIITEMFESGELLELFNTNGIDVNPS